MCIRDRVISYDKEFFEEQEYVFGEEDRVFKITTSHENAVDETRIEYNIFKDEITKTYFVNEVIEKSIRTSTKTIAPNQEQKIVLIKEYVDGEQSKAIEKRFNAKGKLIYQELFLNDSSEDNFVSEEIHLFEYDAEGILKKEIIKKGNSVAEKEFIFQFDANKNWVKKIITPENVYSTRKIEYYPKLEVIETPE